MPPTPDVTVVIPTRGRPALVTRAVHSALAQTLRDIEVVVVVDGPDGSTVAALAGIADPRLRVVELPTSGGAPNARNAGVQAARGAWTALLDDDDEWHPDKLAIQLDLAGNAVHPLPIVISRLVNRTPRTEFVLPRRLPEPGEPLSEYFTVRRGLFHGDGFIQTSTIMAPTELLRRVPFTPDLRRIQELDWALRALGEEGTGLVIAAEPLVTWYTDEDRPRISSVTTPWPEPLDWLRKMRPLVTPRAYAALTMSVISSMAAPTRSPRVFWTLLREAQRYGRPHAIDYLTFLQIWLIPPDLRRTLRDRLRARRPRTAPGRPAASAPVPTPRRAAPLPHLASTLDDPAPGRPNRRDRIAQRR
jgi:glycosyltransferase involved in cell wall biosynthesis